MKLPKQFPRIYRIITENKVSKNPTIRKFYKTSTIILSFVTIIILTILIVLIAVNFSQNFIEFRNVYTQRQTLNGKISFWNSIADKYPGYPDAYFNISLLYYKLGDYSSSRQYLEKTLLYNPNYNNAQKLDNLLKQRGY